MKAKQHYENAKKQHRKFMSGNEKPNKKGRAYLLFPLLERHGIDTWEKLQAESFLIDEKKSQLSREVRDAITHLHTHCMLEEVRNIKEEINV